MNRILSATAAALSLTFSAGVATANPDGPTSPPPQMCGCEWVATGYISPAPGSQEPGRFIYGWVCETVAQCEIYVDP